MKNLTFIAIILSLIVTSCRTIERYQVQKKGWKYRGVTMIEGDRYLFFNVPITIECDTNSTIGSVLCYSKYQQRKICPNNWSVLGIRIKGNKGDSTVVDIQTTKNNVSGLMDTVYIPCNMKHFSKNKK